MQKIFNHKNKITSSQTRYYKLQTSLKAALGQATIIRLMDTYQSYVHSITQKICNN